MNEEIKELLNEIKEDVEKSCEKDLFDPESIKEEAIKMRQKVVDENYGLPYTYKVVCDETNNTPEDVENGVVNADIYFSPKIYTPHINTETVLVKRQTYPSWCCQKCGEQIGYIGRFFQFLRVPFYQCEKCQIPS